MAVRFDLGPWMQARQRRIEAGLRAKVEALPPGRLADGIAYALLEGGKRLRPLLCMAAAEAVGGRSESVLPVALALEFVHTYSLVHDDLPCMDDDDLRRGRPTCHRAFDEATALLVGDALLTFAFELTLEAGAPARGQIARELAQACGPRGMVLGQSLDVHASPAITIAELESIHRLKTGALFATSVRSGGLAAGGSVRELRHLERYARASGLAFQIIDDVLDVVGKSETLGKTVGSDAAKGKPTFATLLGVEGARDRAHGLIEEAIAAVDSLGEPAAALQALARFVVTRDR